MVFKVILLKRQVGNMARASTHKIFNVNADCKPKLHYMVNIDSKLIEIRKMVDRGDYFTINRARQYGKTTTLKALGRYLQKDYVVQSSPDCLHV